MKRPPVPSRGGLVIILAAFAVMVAGIIQFSGVLGARAEAEARSGTALGGLTTSVERAGWLNMDHGQPQTGFQMPAAMMPGMPAEGSERFSVTITIANTGKETRPLHAVDEFSLRAPDGKQWSPAEDTFGDLPRLAPGNAVTGQLFFDLPATDLPDATAARLNWERMGGRRELAIPLGSVDPAPQHQHP
jgi:hypothetical protein